MKQLLPGLGAFAGATALALATPTLTPQGCQNSPPGHFVGTQE